MSNGNESNNILIHEANHTQIENATWEATRQKNILRLNKNGNNTVSSGRRSL